MDLMKLQNLLNECIMLEQGNYIGGNFSVDLAEAQAELDQAKQLLIPRVVSSAMYKATFSFKKYSPRGGNGYWTTEIVPIQAKDETELKEKIATYQANSHNGYHKHIKLTSIELM